MLKLIALQAGGSEEPEEVVLEELQVFKVSRGHVPPLGLGLAVGKIAGDWGRSRTWGTLLQRPG